jgi:hypothetical protein
MRMIDHIWSLSILTVSIGEEQRDRKGKRKRGGESLSLPISSEIKLYLSAPACRVVRLSY